jgi:hypothetical protein
VTVALETDPHVSHLRETELADYIDGVLADDRAKDVRLHLETCTLCSELHAGAATDVPSGATRRTNAAALSSVTGPALPQVLREALDAGLAGSVGAGQLWRLRGPAYDGGEVTALAAIARVDENSVLVVPVTPDPQEATDLWTVQLPVSDTKLEMACWTSVATPVGFEVLDVLVGWTTVAPITDLLRAQRNGQAPPDGLRLGRQIDEELAAYRADLHVEFAQLQDARLVPDDSGADDDDAGGTGTGGVDTPRTDVVEAMLAAEWTPARLKATTGDLTAGEARAVLDRRQQLTAEQLDRVGDALGLAVSGAHPVVDWRWVRVVADPVRRQRFEAVATARSEEPWTLRSVEAASPHLQAARKNEGSWHDIVQLVENRLHDLEVAASLRES